MLTALQAEIFDIEPDEQIVIRKDRTGCLIISRQKYAPTRTVTEHVYPDQVKQANVDLIAMALGKCAKTIRNPEYRDAY